MHLGINVVMDPPKRKNWAEDLSDEWDDEDSPPPPPKPAEPTIRPAPKRDPLLQGQPPYILDLYNLPFALDSEAKVLPYLTHGLASHDLVFKSFHDVPRGCAKVTTSSPEVAKHILSLDGSEETGRIIRVKQTFQEKYPGEHRRGGRKPQDRRERNEGGRAPPPARYPPRPVPPAVIENKNAEYLRKDPPPQAAFRSRVEEIKSEPITPIVVPVQPPKPRTDPFGGAKPIDTRSKDLQFEDKIKKEPASPVKKWGEPKSAGIKPTKAGSGDIKATENTPSDHPQIAEIQKPLPTPDPVPKPEPQVQAKPTPEVPPIITPNPIDTKPSTEIIETQPQEAKPPPEILPKPAQSPKLRETPPQEPPAADPDWDFSDPGTEGRSYQREYPRYQPRGKVILTQRYVRTGKMRSDRPQIPPPATPPLQEHKDEPVAEPQPKPRKRAWTSVEEDREVLAQPPLPEPKAPDPPRGSRGLRGRGR